MAESSVAVKKGFPKWLGITLTIVIAVVMAAIILYHCGSGNRNYGFI